MNPIYLPTTREGKFWRLVEECAEVQKALAKIERFGLFNSYGDGPRNIDHLLAEMDDLAHAMTVVRADMIEELEIERGNGKPGSAAG